jgi:hypothetical protein
MWHTPLGMNITRTHARNPFHPFVVVCHAVCCAYYRYSAAAAPAAAAALYLREKSAMKSVPVDVFFRLRHDNHQDFAIDDEERHVLR